MRDAGTELLARNFSLIYCLDYCNIQSFCLTERYYNNVYRTENRRRLIAYGYYDDFLFTGSSAVEGQ